MRVLLIAVLAAISYAQTEFDLDPVVSWTNTEDLKWPEARCVRPEFDPHKLPYANFDRNNPSADMFWSMEAMVRPSSYAYNRTILTWGDFNNPMERVEVGLTPEGIVVQWGGVVTSNSIPIGYKLWRVETEAPGLADGNYHRFIIGFSPLALAISHDMIGIHSEMNTGFKVPTNPNTSELCVGQGTYGNDSSFHGDIAFVNLYKEFVPIDFYRWGRCLLEAGAGKEDNVEQTEGKVPLGVVNDRLECLDLCYLKPENMTACMFSISNFECIRHTQPVKTASEIFDDYMCHVKGVDTTKQGTTQFSTLDPNRDQGNTTTMPTISPTSSEPSMPPSAAPFFNKDDSCDSIHPDWDAICDPGSTPENEHRDDICDGDTIQGKFNLVPSQACCICRAGGKLKLRNVRSISRWIADLQDNLFGDWTFSFYITMQEGTHREDLLALEYAAAALAAVNPDIPRTFELPIIVINKRSVMARLITATTQSCEDGSNDLMCECVSRVNVTCLMWMSEVEHASPHFEYFERSSDHFYNYHTITFSRQYRWNRTVPTSATTPLEIYDMITTMYVDYDEPDEKIFYNRILTQGNLDLTNYQFPSDDYQLFPFYAFHVVNQAEVDYYHQVNLDEHFPPKPFVYVWIVFVISIAPGLILMVVSTIVNIYMETDLPDYISIIGLMIAVFDWTSDVTLCYVIQKGEFRDPFFFILWSAVCMSYVLSFIALLYWYGVKIREGNGALSDWLNNYTNWFRVSVIFGSANVFLMALLYSRVFPFQAFYMPISLREERLLMGYKIINALVQEIPMFICQFFMWQMGKNLDVNTNLAIMIALMSTTLCLFWSASTFLLRCCLPHQEIAVQWVTVINPTVNLLFKQKTLSDAFANRVLVVWNGIDTFRVRFNYDPSKHSDRDFEAIIRPFVNDESDVILEVHDEVEKLIDQVTRIGNRFNANGSGLIKYKIDKMQSLFSVEFKVDNKRFASEFGEAFADDFTDAGYEVPVQRLVQWQEMQYLKTKESKRPSRKARSILSTTFGRNESNWSSSRYVWNDFKRKSVLGRDKRASTIVTTPYLDINYLRDFTERSHGADIEMQTGRISQSLARNSGTDSGRASGRQAEALPASENFEFDDDGTKTPTTTSVPPMKRGPSKSKVGSDGEGGGETHPKDDPGGKE